MKLRAVEGVLDSAITSLASRLLVTFLFWCEFLNHIRDLNGLHAYVAMVGLKPIWLVMALSLLVQGVGSLLVVLGRKVWLGAGMLGVFTLLTIPIGHPFWTMTGQMAVIERLFSEEHLSVIGGLMAVSILSRREQRDRSPAKGRSAASAQACARAVAAE